VGSMGIDEIIQLGNSIKEKAKYDGMRYHVDGEELERFAFHAVDYIYNNTENQFFYEKVKEYSSDLKSNRYEKLEGILGTIKGQKESSQ
jgi:hypothetical protein